MTDQNEWQEYREIATALDLPFAEMLAVALDGIAASWLSGDEKRSLRRPGRARDRPDFRGHSLKRPLTGGGPRELAAPRSWPPTPSGRSTDLDLRGRPEEGRSTVTDQKSRLGIEDAIRMEDWE
jgi:hypothetical protein